MGARIRLLLPKFSLVGWRPETHEDACKFKLLCGAEVDLSSHAKARVFLDDIQVCALRNAREVKHFLKHPVLCDFGMPDDLHDALAIARAEVDSVLRRKLVNAAKSRIRRWKREQRTATIKADVLQGLRQALISKLQV